MTLEVTSARPFDDFFRESFPGMLGRAIALCGHRQDAEDAVQEAFVEALRRWDRIGGYESPEAWVHRVMTQRLAKVHRKRQAGTGRLGELPSPPRWGPEEAGEFRELLTVLEALPPVQRMTLVLHCLEDLPQRDIAGRMGITRGTVASTIFKARHNLRLALGLGDDGRPLPGHDLVGATGGPLPDAHTDRLLSLVTLLDDWLRDSVAAEPAAASRAYADVIRRAATRRWRLW